MVIILLDITLMLKPAMYIIKSIICTLDIMACMFSRVSHNVRPLVSQEGIYSGFKEAQCVSCV